MFTSLSKKIIDLSFIHERCHVSVSATVYSWYDFVLFFLKKNAHVSKLNF